MKKWDSLFNNIVGTILFVLFAILVVIAIIAIVVLVLFLTTCLVCIMTITLPFYLLSPLAVQHMWYMYEIQCAILNVLRVARFDTAVRDGWMLRIEILFEVEKSFNEQVELAVLDAVLDWLVEEGVVEYRHVPARWVKSDNQKDELVTAHKLVDDSYKPQIPRNRPRKKKGRYVGEYQSV